jgi:hypothetical protein
MLDKIINRHLDVMDKVEESIAEDISRIIQKIDIAAIMQNPFDELSEITEAVKKLLEDEYIPKAINEGAMFSKAIEKDGDIIIQDSDNPELNA